MSFPQALKAVLLQVGAKIRLFILTYYINLFNVPIMKKFGLSSFKRRLRRCVSDYTNHLDYLFSKCLNDYTGSLDNSYNLYSKKLLKLFLFFSIIQTIIFVLYCIFL